MGSFVSANRIRQKSTHHCPGTFRRPFDWRQSTFNRSLTRVLCCTFQKVANTLTFHFFGFRPKQFFVQSKVNYLQSQVIWVKKAFSLCRLSFNLVHNVTAYFCGASVNPRFLPVLLYPRVLQCTLAWNLLRAYITWVRLRMVPWKTPWKLRMNHAHCVCDHEHKLYNLERLRVCVWYDLNSSSEVYLRCFAWVMMSIPFIMDQ